MVYQTGNVPCPSTRLASPFSARRNAARRSHRRAPGRDQRARRCIVNLNDHIRETHQVRLGRVRLGLGRPPSAHQIGMLRGRQNKLLGVVTVVRVPVRRQGLGGRAVDVAHACIVGGAGAGLAAPDLRAHLGLEGTIEQTRGPVRLGPTAVLVARPDDL